MWEWDRLQCPTRPWLRISSSDHGWMDFNSDVQLVLDLKTSIVHPRGWGGGGEGLPMCIISKMKSKYGWMLKRVKLITYSINVSVNCSFYSTLGTKKLLLTEDKWMPALKQEVQSKGFRCCTNKTLVLFLASVMNMTNETIKMSQNESKNCLLTLTSTNIFLNCIVYMLYCTCHDQGR